MFATDLQALRQLRYAEGERILTLSELLELTQDKVGLNLELKLYDGRRAELERAVRAELETYRSSEPMWITSLDAVLIESWESNSPADTTGLIITASAETLTDTSVDWLIVNDFYYRQARAQFAEVEKPVALWSFDPNWTGEEAFEAGLAGAITDRPSVLQERENNFAALDLEDQIPRITVWNFTH